MKISIICDEAEGNWIYSEFIEKFKKYSKHTILVNEKNENKIDIFHFLPYYNCFDTVKPCTAWFSHQEAKEPLKSKFISCAEKVDFAISQSKKYTDLLKQNGVENVKQIITGVDTAIFCLRSTKRPKNEKLVLGFAGRNYVSSDRKNPKLLERIKSLSFVDFRTTGGKMTAGQIPKFYSNLDLVLSPATREGGPLCIQQGLACGVPIICFGGVGVADEFAHGIIKVPFGDSDDFLSRLEIIWKTKSYLDWRDAGRMNLMREQVKDQTWTRFVYSHDKVWEALV